MNRCGQNKKFVYLVVTRFIFPLMIWFIQFSVLGQCPPNIDFENGDFSGWTLYTGNVSSATGQNIISLSSVPGPVAGRHEMLSTIPGNGMDEFGNFPKNCPDGSQHSIKLGNVQGGNQAEGASYEFTIPANANKFSLIYYYAIVMQNPGHEAFQQPRLEIEVLNVTDHTPIGCSSFAFIANGELPGFLLSPHILNNTPVWYKPWGANTINLDGNEGKRIRIFFKTADCTYISHFGYAYIDLSAQCSSTFIGATYCPGDSAVDISAPFGYLQYTWFNHNFSQILGNSQVLHLSPVPAPGTDVFVKLTPYSGYGCEDTLRASLVDTLSILAQAGEDKVVCNNFPVQLGRPPLTGLVYKWTPAAGLNNPNIANPIANISIPTRYILSVRSRGGGCPSTDTVMVGTGFIDNTLEITGDSIFCEGQGSPTILKVHSADSIQWYHDGIALNGETRQQFTPSETGTYHATLFSNSGCISNTSSKHIIVYPSPAVSLSVNNDRQCLLENEFNFRNGSSISSGPLEYTWKTGDGSMFYSRDLVHRYSKAGEYTVLLQVKAGGRCERSDSMRITVLPSAIADFSVHPVCINRDIPVLNQTVYNGSSPVHYQWEFGNLPPINQISPVVRFAQEGTYNIRLTVYTDQCPQRSTKERNLIVDKPLPGIRYTDQAAIYNFPLQLEARNIGSRAWWEPATNLDNRGDFRPRFRGISSQLYTINISTATGCQTVDTQYVKIIKKIEIHVPEAFTPDGDGLNDYLRPLLYGFKKVNYFRIYNRWGKLLFQMANDQPGWDGKERNIPQDMQTVIWMIEAVDADGNLHREKGNTILVR